MKSSMYGAASVLAIKACKTVTCGVDLTISRTLHALWDLPTARYLFAVSISAPLFTRFVKTVSEGQGSMPSDLLQPLLTHW